MSDARERLTRCFQAVFPDLNGSEIERASKNRVSKWDSVTVLSLVAAVEEEFALQFDVAEIEELNSFDAFLTRIDRKAQ